MIIGRCKWCTGPVHDTDKYQRCLEPETDYREEVTYHQTCLDYGKHLDDKDLGWKRPDLPPDADPIEYQKELQRRAGFLGENTPEAVERANSLTREFVAWAKKRDADRLKQGLSAQTIRRLEGKG